MPRQKKLHFEAIAINFKKLALYNFNYLSLEEAVLFEFLLIKSIYWKFKPFPCSHRKICQETGIKLTRFKKALARLEELNFVGVGVKNFPKVRVFRMKILTIIAYKSEIYLSTDEHEDFWNDVLNRFNSSTK